jgi:hypothetical protein
MLTAVARAHAEPTARYQLTDQEQRTILEEEDADLCKKLADLEEEYRQNAAVCYMHQEMLEGKKNKRDQIYNHRFKLVTPGALGVYKSGERNCNQVNVNNLGKLVNNLNQMMLDKNKDRKDAVKGYACRYCFRSLYLNASRRERSMCACLRCVSALYCSTICRYEDSEEHRFSCFLHPGWECEDSTKQRVEELRAAGLKAMPSTDATDPVMEPTNDPKEDSRGDFDAAAQMQDDYSIVSVEGAEEAPAGAAAQAAADGEAEQQDGTKTAIGGESDVDVTEP